MGNFRMLRNAFFKAFLTSLREKITNLIITKEEKTLKKIWKMNHIKTGILAREIMNKNFPIIDSSLPLITCVKKMNKQHQACLVMKNGNFSGILGHDEILRGFIYGKDKNAKIEKIKTSKNFKIVRPDSDVYNTLLLMKENNVDFVLVKNKKNFVGLITKREIADVEPILFESAKEVR